MSTPKRFFVMDINYPERTEVVIEGEEFNHAKNVLRIEEGSEIVLLDNSGKEYSAIVAKIEKRTLLAHIIGVNDGIREAERNVILLIGALKGDKTELVVQKATELGIYKIGVFNSKYCSAFMSENKLERLNKVSRESAKQCLRSIAPEVIYFDDLQKALKTFEKVENKLFACEFISQSQQSIKHLNGDCVLVVGSEGGFAEEEFEQATALGYKGITLGKRILRAETAAITLSSIVMFELGELN